MPDDRFAWLHLTDLHVGLGAQRHLWPNVEERVLEDLSKLHSRCGPWHAVFFTGDLTQEGKAEEFAKLQQILDRLQQHLRKLDSDPVLIAVWT